MSLPKETERLVADPAPGITALPHEDNLRYFDVTIEGPEGSPFERATVGPNVRVDHGVASDKWSPALQIRTVLLSIQALLSAPNPDDPLATDVAKHYKENEKDAQRVSREWTRTYANLD
ncbi:hypothetical protein H0H81_012163 [Sphagnurus paluster]|uniref:UBC core domain-containing protein n=1 Tax=Sphagnurus paluster TaxID=117069 RepID=A0A9P7FWH7_9AGAR|nr:hypothetical protein H0H81_012163 [Sphagnurus paluster]